MARHLHDHDLALGPLRLKVHGRQFPALRDFWDGNWLVITAQVDTDGRRTKVEGPYLRTAELARWLGELEALQRTLEGTACLDPVEPHLEIDLEVTLQGQVEAQIRLLPDTTKEPRVLRVPIGPSDLADLTEALRGILDRLPVRSPE